MKIESLACGDLRIWMTEHDLTCFGFGLQDLREKTPAADRAVRRLLGLARQRVIFQPHGPITVEALPLEDGCILVFCASGRIWPQAAPQIFLVPSADDLMRFGEALSGTSRQLPIASLYGADGAYYLIVYADSVADLGYSRLLSEFATPVAEGYTAAACMEEHGTPLAVGNALSAITVRGSRSPARQHPTR